MTRPPVPLLALALLVACSGTQTSIGTVAAPPPKTLPPATTITTSSTTTTTSSTSTTTVPATTTSTVEAETTVVDPKFHGLSPDGPWKLVASAPGVTTPGLIYELMPKLWVFLPAPFTSGEDLFPAPDADIPIIEAYVRAKLVYFRAITSRPMNLDDPEWRTYFTDRGAAGFFEWLRPARDKGEYADLDQGVVLRPHVIGNERSTTAAIVFDCILDGGVFRMPDGSLAPGSREGIGREGSAARMVLLKDQWVVALSGTQREACW